ncbi:MAG: ABC transporter substrate-binding protein [Deinococcota bacterium]
MKYLLVFLFLVTSLSIAQEFPLTVTDSAGQDVTLDAVPETVIALWNESVSNLVFIGEKPDATLAIDLAEHPAYYGDGASDILMLEHNDWTPDYEQLLSLEPDLILGDEDTATTIGDFATIYLENYDVSISQDDFFQDVRNLAQVFGKEDIVEARIERLLDRAEAYSIASGRSKTFYYGFNADADGDVWNITRGGAICAFIQPANTCDSDYGDAWKEVSVEGLLALDPDVLIVEDHGDGWTEETLTALNNLEANALWQELSAYKDEQIHFVERAVSRPEDPLVFELWLDEIMPLAYPDIFPAPLTNEQVQEILANE